ncbi:30S ribosomal protein S3 [Candidatus Gracilibacteria bacterium]|nr:30S ribosomal protein S3 [Candidatus Gracilibacteria bacterium]MCF7819093.1 30S ribosomal protein S3 [Candidatus Gracilibacteria bacterium]
MGKKVSPHSLRIGITRTWDSKWYAKRDFKEKFLQDLEIREFLNKKLEKAGIAKIEIQRSNGKISVIVSAAKPGIIIGRGGEAIESLSKELRQKFQGAFDVSVQEVRKPDTNAKLIAQSVADQISRRFPYRRVVKMAIDRAKDAGVKGVKITVAGRLNGVDISRSETYSHGTVPLHTLRANIDYASTAAPTTYGSIGIKVWVYHGLVFKNENLNEFLGQ